MYELYGDGIHDDPKAIQEMIKPLNKRKYSNRLMLSNCPSNKDECKAAQGCFC